MLLRVSPRSQLASGIVRIERDKQLADRQGFLVQAELLDLFKLLQDG